MQKNLEKQIKELSLLLLYLTSWEEDAGVEEIKARRAWKEYDFTILDELKKEGLIDFSHKAKSAFITDKGIKEAAKIKKKYLKV